MQVPSTLYINVLRFIEHLHTVICATRLNDSGMKLFLNKLIFVIVKYILTNFRYSSHFISILSWLEKGYDILFERFSKPFTSKSVLQNCVEDSRSTMYTPMLYYQNANNNEQIFIAKVQEKEENQWILWLRESNNIWFNWFKMMCT